MKIIPGEFKTSAPGRICLFGEHQDYLGLPVIASAISLRIYISAKHRNDNIVNISLPDLNTSESFALDELNNYYKERDYFRSALNVMKRNGFFFSRGLDCSVHGEIPVNAGTSSSSALIVAWINLLAAASDQGISLSPENIAELAYLAEVKEFNEPGGKMDHYTSALGGTLELNFYPSLEISKLHARTGAFVLGNSREPKNTKDILSGVKNRVTGIADDLKNNHKKFSLHEVSLEELSGYKDEINPAQYELLKGTIENRDITRSASVLMQAGNFNEKEFGTLIYRHHTILRDVLKISTPKIDSMIETAMNAGAYGAKINGSGGGGCMFAYAPENTGEILEAVKSISGEAYIVHTAGGTQHEKII